MNIGCLGLYVSESSNIFSLPVDEINYKWAILSRAKYFDTADYYWVESVP